jgi:hypothetical protein
MLVSETLARAVPDGMPDSPDKVRRASGPPRILVRHTSA